MSRESIAKNEFNNPSSELVSIMSERRNAIDSEGALSLGWGMAEFVAAVENVSDVEWEQWTVLGLVACDGNCCSMPMCGI